MKYFFKLLTAIFFFSTIPLHSNDFLCTQNGVCYTVQKQKTTTGIPLHEKTRKEIKRLLEEKRTFDTTLPAILIPTAFLFGMTGILYAIHKCTKQNRY